VTILKYHFENDVKKRISFYLADYDMLGQIVRIEGFDLITNKILFSSECIDISMGLYMVFEVSGIFKFRFSRIKGPDVTISVIFYD